MTMVLDGCRDVVDLVGGRDEGDVDINAAQVMEIGGLASEPRRLGGAFGREGVRQTVNQPLDVRPEFGVDGVETTVTAMVFGGIVEDGGDGLILGPAMFENEARDAEEVRQIGDRFVFASVGRMEDARYIHSPDEPIGELRHRNAFRLSARLIGHVMSPSAGDVQAQPTSAIDEHGRNVTGFR
jgi:hypothetical protein